MCFSWQSPTGYIRFYIWGELALNLFWELWKACVLLLQGSTSTLSSLSLAEPYLTLSHPHISKKTLNSFSAFYSAYHSSIWVADYLDHSFWVRFDLRIVFKSNCWRHRLHCTFCTWTIWYKNSSLKLSMNWYLSLTSRELRDWLHKHESCIVAQ